MEIKTDIKSSFLSSCIVKIGDVSKGVNTGSLLLNIFIND